MKAKVGDQVVVDRRRPGDVERRGEILEVRGEEDAPRYLVRWSDGHESIFVPGPEAAIEPREPEETQQSP
jgi:hypothetical protein